MRKQKLEVRLSASGQAFLFDSRTGKAVAGPLPLKELHQITGSIKRARKKRGYRNPTSLRQATAHYRKSLRKAPISYQRSMKSFLNPGQGKAFTFHGSYQSLILARRKEREIPGSFIHKSGNRYYVLKPKRIGEPSKSNPKRVVIYGRVLKIYAQKTSGPYKGQKFVHTFKPGAVLTGLPDGSLRISNH